MRPWQPWLVAAALGAGCVGVGCGGESVEAQPVAVPVWLAAAPGEVTTDLGYTVRLTVARQVLTNLVFTRGGEAHAGSFGWLVGRAHAHPGHAAGGEARGELPGRFVVDWLGGEGLLGTASVLPGRLDGLDFGLGTAGRADVAAGKVAEGDGIVGHNLYLEAEVQRGDQRWTLAVAVPQDLDEQVTGVVCAATIGREPGLGLVLALRVADPFEDDTVFDGIDFAVEDADGDGHIAPGADETLTNRIRRALATHDHYEVSVREGVE